MLENITLIAFIVSIAGAGLCVYHILCEFGKWMCEILESVNEIRDSVKKDKEL